MSPMPPSSSPTPDLEAGPGLYGEDVDPLPKRVAVEVELTRKGARPVREAWTGPAWPLDPDRLLRPARGRRLPDRPAARIRPRHPIQVHPLPEVPGHQLPALHPPRRCLVTRPDHPAPVTAGRPPRPADPPGRPPARCQRPAAGHAGAGLDLPLSIVAWLVGQAVILLQRRWHWWRFASPPSPRSRAVLVLVGPEEALRRHIFVPQHFWQYVALHFGFGPPGTESPSASSSGTC